MPLFLPWCSGPLVFVLASQQLTNIGRATFRRHSPFTPRKPLFDCCSMVSTGNPLESWIQEAEKEILALTAEARRLPFAWYGLLLDETHPASFARLLGTTKDLLTVFLEAKGIISYRKTGVLILSQIKFEGVPCSRQRMNRS